MNFVIFGIPVHICQDEIMAFIYSSTCLACLWRFISSFVKSRKKKKPCASDHSGCHVDHSDAPKVTDK